MTTRSAGTGERLMGVSADPGNAGCEAEQAAAHACLSGTGRPELTSAPCLVVTRREQLLLHPVPALQAAPQPVRVDHVQLPAFLGLAHLLRAC